MLAAINLDQLAKMIAPNTRLMKPAPLLARQPEPFLAHPFAQRLSRNFQVMTFEKHLARERRPEITIALLDVSKRNLANMRSQQTIGGPTARAVAKAGRSTICKLARQPMCLASCHAHQARRRGHRQSSRKNRRQHLCATKLSFAHLHPAHARLPNTFFQGSVTFLVCHSGTF